MRNKTIWLGFFVLLFIPFAFAGTYGNETYGNETYGNTSSAGAAAAAVTFSSNPAVASTGSTSVSISATTSVAATCKYASGNIGYNSMTSLTNTGGTSHSGTISNLVAGTGYTYYVTCRDGNSNDVTKTVDFTTTSTSSGGSSGGGSSGGTASAAVIGQSAKELWAVVKEGEKATLKIDNGEIGISEVSVVANEDVYGVWLEVEKVDELPSEVSVFSGKTYKNMKITGGNTEKVINPDSPAKVKFNVKKSWLTENNVVKNNVALFRFFDGKWMELVTTMDKDDGNYVYYTALTPGLSYFSIGEKTGKYVVEKVTIPKTETEDIKEAVPASATGKAIEQKPVATETKFNVLWIVPLVVLVLVVVFILLMVQRRKRHLKKKTNNVVRVVSSRKAVKSRKAKKQKAKQRVKEVRKRSHKKSKKK